ncbi:hypothetical protein Hsero_4192 [Herbaspirillum seropedicae SmR1]|uniref:Uncharacterized protein n=1 Tax=Herbaspirillum seropedicae (strain SmR1) TaxID=757424 RepID=D8ITN1_HERSS|nr:hypothetical protein Hsero_4192 [Herbaspirillum seropedicae SmR1]
MRLPSRPAFANRRASCGATRLLIRQREQSASAPGRLPQCCGAVSKRDGWASQVGQRSNGS